MGDLKHGATRYSMLMLKNTHTHLGYIVVTSTNKIVINEEKQNRSKYKLFHRRNIIHNLNIGSISPPNFWFCIFVFLYLLPPKQKLDLANKRVLLYFVSVNLLSI